MNRRKALKSLSLGLGTALVLPSWANAWNKDTFSNANFETPEILGAIVNCIIPETDTPGAKTIGAHLYLERMINDCFSPVDQETFKQGLIKIDQLSNTSYQKSFIQLSLEEQTNVLKMLETSETGTDRKAFYLLKNLTIRAYTNSEYFLSNHRDYVMAPAFYHGCVSINS